MPETRYHEDYRNGQMVSRTAYEVSDDQMEREQATTRLRACLPRLLNSAQQAEAMSQQGPALTLLQLTIQQRQIAGLLGDIARDLRAVVRYLGEP